MANLVGLVIVLTVPALYERYEDQIDKYVLLEYIKLMQLYMITSTSQYFLLVCGLRVKTKSPHT